MKSLSNQQRLHLVNSEQLYDNYRVALRHAAAHRYGMRWKTVRGVEYLFRDRDARGNGRSLEVERHTHKVDFLTEFSLCICSRKYVVFPR